MIKKLFDTNLPANWATTLSEQFYFDIAPDHYDKMITIIMMATSQVLNAASSKEFPVTMKYSKVNGEFIAAATRSYEPNKNKDLPGSWTLAWSWNENDIPANAKIIELNDPNVLSYYRAIAGSKYSMEFDNSNVIVPIVNTTLTTLKKWLDENAHESDIVGVEIPTACEAAVQIEGGVKVFSLTPIGEAKAIAKNDADLEN